MNIKKFKVFENVKNGLTVKELKEKLNEFPDDYAVIFYEQGSVYDTKINKVFVRKYDKIHNFNRVTLTN